MFFQSLSLNIREKNEANRVRRIFSKVARAGSGLWSAGQRWCKIVANASFLGCYYYQDAYKGRKMKGKILPVARLQ